MRTCLSKSYWMNLSCWFDVYRSNRHISFDSVINYLQNITVRCNDILIAETTLTESFNSIGLINVNNCTPNTLPYRKQQFTWSFPGEQWKTSTTVWHMNLLVNPQKPATAFIISRSRFQKEMGILLSANKFRCCWYGWNLPKIH